MVFLGAAMQTHVRTNSAMVRTTNRANAVFRALAALWLVSTIIFVFWYEGDTLGWAGYSGNGVQHVSAGTTPAALVLALVGVAIVSLVAKRELHVFDFQIAPLWRRYVAVLIDLWFFVFTYGALSAMIPLMLEARRTGAFQWAFERDYVVSADWLGGVLVLTGLAAMVGYFVLTLANRRQTLGRWMVRIATVNVDGSAVRLPVFVALRRTYKEARELGSRASFWRMVRGKPGHEETWYDESDPFIVVRY